MDAVEAAPVAGKVEARLGSDGADVVDSQVNHEIYNDDVEFLRARVPFISAEDMDALEVVRPLAEGSFGCTTIVSCNGMKTIKKVLKCEENVKQMLWEARVTAELNGTGGAPRVMAVCFHPPAILLAHSGRTYDDFVERHCTVGGFLDSIVVIAQLLSEIHLIGFLHNDLKGSNIMVQGPNPRPSLHIIDYGLATRIGAPFNFEFFGINPNALKKYSSFRSPEMFKGLPLGSASDVFSLGVMIGDVVHYAKFPLFKKLLAPVMSRCAMVNPELRPTLAELALEVVQVKAKMSQKIQRKRIENIRGQSVSPKKSKGRR
ncbi:putative serine/threonine-protein kinase 2 [Portunus trituberculatus]|uniref:Putative serine/threonine-protein kinase 2 n=1 Tax=Portunus trituberculatus TaxID=210409 RepID=A0A5B7HP26_PORTR|nr:putative serine/threonine-protein kinase 2 [Portunus trituberculatus]